jgi:Cu(I)/Ag(I) efflux system protein CusF
MNEEINVLRKFCLGAALGAAIATAPSLAAAQATEKTAPPASSSEAMLTAGVVRKVDKDAGKVTIRHEPIKNLDMPEMTMVFRVIDPAMLDQLKPGDKIRFAADKVNGNYTVMRFETAK